MSPLLQKKIYDKLAATSAVTALTSTRIYPQDAPQAPTVPYVIFEEVASSTIETHDDDLTLDRTTVQFTCISKTSREAADLRWKVRAALCAVGALSGVKVSSPLSRQSYVEPIKAFSAQLDLSFWHNPSAAS